MKAVAALRVGADHERSFTAGQGREIAGVEARAFPAVEVELHNPRGGAVNSGDVSPTVRAKAGIEAAHPVGIEEAEGVAGMRIEHVAELGAGEGLIQNPTAGGIHGGSFDPGFEGDLVGEVEFARVWGGIDWGLRIQLEAGVILSEQGEKGEEEEGEAEVFGGREVH
jgi:hypothetical protein